MFCGQGGGRLQLVDCAWTELEVGWWDGGALGLPAPTGRRTHGPGHMVQRAGRRVPETACQWRTECPLRVPGVPGSEHRGFRPRTHFASLVVGQAGPLTHVPSIETPPPSDLRVPGLATRISSLRASRNHPPHLSQHGLRPGSSLSERTVPTRSGSQRPPPRFPVLAVETLLHDESFVC